MKHFRICRRTPSNTHTSSVIMLEDFFTCVGDEKGICDRCVAKFQCYTGELAGFYLVDNSGLALSLKNTLEFNLFFRNIWDISIHQLVKKLGNIIDYDIEAYKYGKNILLGSAQ